MPSTAVLEASGKVPGVEGRPLRLEEALRLARVRNQDVKSARLSVDAALAELRSARQWQNPSLGLSVARINTGSQGSGTALGNRLDQRSYDSITSLSQLIELGGKRSLRIESAEAGRRQAEAQAEDSQRLLEQSVALAYVSGAEAQEEARILAESAASLTKEAALAAERLRVGDIRSSDEEQIRLAAERLEVQADTARSRALGLVVALELLTGEAQPRGTSLLVDGPGAGSVEPVSETGEAILSERPDVQALLEGMRKSELDLTRSKRDAVPDLTASLQFEHNPPGPDSLGFSVSFPLPVWNRNRGAIQTARVQRDIARLQYEKGLSQAHADVASDRAALVATRREAEAYTQRLVPAAKHILETISYAYRKGAASLLDLLQAERDNNDLRIAAAQAQAEHAAAVFALNAAVHRMNKSQEAHQP